VKSSRHGKYAPLFASVRAVSGASGQTPSGRNYPAIDINAGALSMDSTAQSISACHIRTCSISVLMIERM